MKVTIIRHEIVLHCRCDIFFLAGGSRFGHILHTGRSACHARRTTVVNETFQADAPRVPSAGAGALQLAFHLDVFFFWLTPAADPLAPPGGRTRNRCRLTFRMRRKAPPAASRLIAWRRVPQPSAGGNHGNRGNQMGKLHTKPRKPWKPDNFIRNKKLSFLFSQIVRFPKFPWIRV